MRIFGHVSYYRPGDVLASRLELSRAGLHRPTRAGISGSAQEGADSIVLADQYEDDVFGEDEIIYAGHGGRDPKTGHQTTDQDLNDRNRALLRSQETGQPVRVLRKAADGYRYEGLYRVVGSSYEPGRSGFQVWLFRLVPVV
ncbi:YDG/SRA domain-containing protein [Hymenobacter weizhouensis]|uniref:YDG/SRA domain-containing protein n=1 Tax=Hymenobacter sp. YIM 151500-1 TaxID=2987689 RepID=UPI00222768F5|nr:YDG/SRA domain-containing protein [Hymenobacter sp. YIM 151500-1]UYZ63166.1 YDG/SRA domain-containing protein [Hymenobacter sp. YIM 151500-1]